MSPTPQTGTVICPTCNRECGPEEPFCWRCQTPLRGSSSGKSVSTGGTTVRRLALITVLLLAGGAVAYKYWWQALPTLIAKVESAQAKVEPPEPKTVEALVGRKPKVSVLPAKPVPKFVEVPGKPLTWEATSADGRAVLAQESQGTACAFTCTSRTTKLWSASGPCQGTVNDLHFVSADCERSVTFFIKPEGKERNFIGVYDRILVAWKVPAAALVENLVGLPPHLIQGMGETTAGAPAYSSDGELVDFKTVDGKAQQVPLRP